MGVKNKVYISFSCIFCHIFLKLEKFIMKLLSVHMIFRLTLTLPSKIDFSFLLQHLAPCPFPLILRVPATLFVRRQWSVICVKLILEDLSFLRIHSCFWCSSWYDLSCFYSIPFVMISFFAEQVFKFWSVIYRQRWCSVKRGEN